ncbi:MAG: 2-C-methyl-D-erythritol 4-phosphate cytidylyltransferase [Clostridia bacterium]|nr:2-C-methyl-D-erythritol 4-phosphate cytidylyltransferase [Clostridia bacterium]
MVVSAVIVAAGGSTRMGKPKQFLEINGCPLIVYTLKAFEQCDRVDDIVLVARKEDFATMEHLIEQYNIQKIKKVVAGGDSRQESVWNGVSLCDTADYVAIHDGARPLITPALITKAITAAVECGAAALGVRVKDTVKRVDANGFILETPPREQLWNVQTPQIFKYSLYEKAVAFATENHLTVTDDCQMVEALGVPVRLIEGDYTNIKATTPEDIQVAKEWLS